MGSQAGGGSNTQVLSNLDTPGHGLEVVRPRRQQQQLFSLRASVKSGSSREEKEESGEQLQDTREKSRKLPQNQLASSLQPRKQQVSTKANVATVTEEDFLCRHNIT